MTIQAEERNQAQLLLEQLGAGRNDDNKPFKSRVRMGVLADLVGAAYQAVRDEKPATLIHYLSGLQRQSLVHSDGEIVDYLTGSLLVITRALLIQAGEYEDPHKKGADNGEATEPGAGDAG